MPAMENLRRSADALEQLTDRSYWPFPTYDELLFSV
jgi:glutamine synthetase